MLIVYYPYLCPDIVDVLSCSARPELAALIPMHPEITMHMSVGVYVSM